MHVLNRELALQIHDVLSKFAPDFSQLRCTLFIGGTSVAENSQDFIENGGQVVIGTPGRILDVTNRTRELNWKKLEVLVLDEADKLLDMGFRDSLNQIFSLLPKQRRTGLFSATQTKEVKELARAGLRNPVTVSVRVQNRAKPSADGGDAIGQSIPNISVPQATPTTLENWYLIREYDARIHELLQFIKTHRSSKTIVFCATCACVEYYSHVIPQLLRQDAEVMSQGKIAVVGFHGKMLAKKRSLLFKKFKGLAAGVMFSTDVAARGIDIPDVDWIIQLAAPKDPAFFVHRVGRTARAGRRGGALLFVTPEEEPYVELLRGRGVPLRLTDSVALDGQTSSVKSAGNDNSADGEETADQTPVLSADAQRVLQQLKDVAKSDRDALETGSTAFMSFIRAYKEHLCSYIFRLENLDIGAVARAYGLLRLPKMAETRGVKGKPIVFETDAMDTATIPFKHTEKEEKRLRKLKESIEAEARIQAAEENGEEIDSDDARTARASIRTARSMKSMRSTKSGKSRKTGVASVWVPVESFERKEEPRERKKKQSLRAKFADEWDELAAEETLFKKFKKGKISKEKYEKALFKAEAAKSGLGENDDDSDDDKVGKKRRRKGKDSDSDDDSDDDSDREVSRPPQGSKQAKHGKVGRSSKKFDSDEDDGSDYDVDMDSD